MAAPAPPHAERSVSSARRATSRPIGREAVAAGEGAFSTCTARAPSRIRKSSTSVPSRSTAWARTPAAEGTRSSAVTAGSSLRTAVVNALRDTDRRSSPVPYRQCCRAICHDPGQASVAASSRGRTVPQS